MNKKSSASNGIHNLPRNIIDNILKYLPLDDAVRTSVLSKEWRYKWLTIPNLIFDCDFNDMVPEKDRITIIYQVLLLHEGSIEKFELDVSDLETSFPYINHLIHFLSKHHIREFELNLCSSDQYNALSSHLFTFEHLKHLCLTRCEFKPPSAFKGFVNLVKLELERVNLLPEKFFSFVSNCPLLEYLELQKCTRFENLEIDAPNLKSFHFYGSFRSISFTNTPLLEQVTMTLDLLYNNSQESNLVDVFGHLSCITKLEFNYITLQYLARDGLPEKLPDDLNYLKVLRLDDTALNTISEVSCVLCLLRSSPNLECLVISLLPHVDEEVDQQKEALRLLKAQEKCKISLNRLNYVGMEGFQGLEHEMEFVKLLLTSATTLEKLEIWPEDLVDTKQECEILKGLTRFCRASSKAKIIFSEPKLISD